MGKAKAATNNSSIQRRRYVGEDVVVPVMYDGHYVGNGGQYMAGMVNGKLVEDKNGKPLPLKAVGVLR
tara:strand:- start:100 stop:303 length:204 start_codon:yes stop_codon:yes gene_type:complete